MMTPVFASEGNLSISPAKNEHEYKVKTVGDVITLVASKIKEK